MTHAGFSRGRNGTKQIVAILEIDAAANTATGLTRRESHVVIDLSYSPSVTPVKGEQWNVTLMTTPRGTQWVLDSKLPFNTPETLTPTTAGQQQVGTGNGPVQLHGTQVNANGPLRLVSGSVLSGLRRRMGDTSTGLPAPNAVDAGSMAYDEDVQAPTYSDGTDWTPLATAAQVASKYVLPPGGVPAADLNTSVQNALTLAGTALQNVPANSVGATQIVNGSIGTTQLATGVQTSLTKANTALQSLSGSPYDLALIAFSQTSVRAVGAGDNPFGIKLQRACTLTSVTYRCATADATGTLTVELRRNGSTITGTSTNILAANQVAGGTSSFSQACNAGDIITVYVTAIGGTPGLGLAVDVTGVMA